MIRPPSLVKEYTWIWSKDPALDAPDDSATEDVLKAWADRLQRARETGNYDGLIRPGEKPTLFGLRLVPQDKWAALWSAHHAGDIGLPSLPIYGCRLALQRVTNTGLPDGDPEVKPGRAAELPRWVDQLGAMASPDMLNVFGGLAPAIAGELFGDICERQSAPSPK